MPKALLCQEEPWHGLLMASMWAGAQQQVLWHGLLMASTWAGVRSTEVLWHGSIMAGMCVHAQQ
jgi:hypothetical protein